MIDAGRKRDWVDRKLRHLRQLVDCEIGLPDCGSLTDEAAFAGLVGARGAPRLFLGTYSVPEVEAALERFGILPALRARGLSPTQIGLDTSDAERHTFSITCPIDGQQRLIAETALRVGCFDIDAPFAPLLRGQRFRMIFILWLLMQHPGASFSAARPALPGQVFPGLGIGRQVEQVYLAMARRLGCDGLVNSPEFAHTAVLYSRYYRFVDPEVEGRLLSLRRSLSGLGLAEGAWALHTGCVRLTDAGGQPYYWVPEDQVLPLSPALQAHFRSPAYVRAVKRSLETHRFVLDRERLAALAPLLPDGSPRPAV
ncbi:MAG: hypothetical protein RBU45_00055 [Myxococcota bacterium]|jgi:hypothetical protein|nr:hypothetical protein [Myxococcota bacterium]